jgi:MazG family protein
MQKVPVPGAPPDAVLTQQAFWQLVEVVARLRAPDGCPWDREQTLKTIEPFTLEETYEVFEAIDADDNPGISEELGDLLLQVVLYAQIAADEGRFDLVPVIQGITEKLIRRHPHVFENGQAHTSDQVLRNWERVKQQEKQRESALDGVPLALPALARAVRLQSKAAKVGFEWPERDYLWTKLHEEIQELAVELFPAGQPSVAQSAPLNKRPTQTQAMSDDAIDSETKSFVSEWPPRDVLQVKLREEIPNLVTGAPDQVRPDQVRNEDQVAESINLPDVSGSVPVSTAAATSHSKPDADRQQRMEDELGDVLFVVANLARRWGINPEDALRRSNEKFSRRFRAIESQVLAQGRRMQDTSLEEMERIYDEIKRLEKIAR